MGRTGIWALGTLLPAALLGVLCGCCGFSQNPSYFPYLLPTGDIKRTHAKPPGLGYYADFDPRACRLEVRPLELTTPVRTQHVLIATVYDDRGVPRRNRRVEWLLEGAGHIVEVDESGYAPGRGYKVDNRYAVSYTNYFEHRVTRGNNNPDDDFVVRPGQTWCVISAASEGDTYVTVYAPAIANWDAQKVVVTHRWVDASWQFPPPATARSGSEQPLTTLILRATDRQPLANYRVRYRVLDGPPAVFLPARTAEAVVVSDLSGQATATLVQAAAQAGVNRLGVEVIRPPDPTAPSGAGIVLGRSETTVQWLAPQISLSNTGPASARVEDELTYTVTVANTGTVETQAMTVRSLVPEGCQYVRSQPPAVVEGNQVIWTLGVLPGGQAHTVQVTYKAVRLGTVNHCANVTTAEGLRDEKCTATIVADPQLTLTVNGPATAVVGVPVTYQVILTNPGSGPATNVLLTAAFDPGLEHETRANPLESQVGTLTANETRTVPLVLTPRQAGRLVTRLTATADGNLRANAEHALTAQIGKVAVTISGPGWRYLERSATWDIQVSNDGDVAVGGVSVRTQLPPELAFISATASGQVVGRDVVWTVGTLQPREQRQLQVTTRCVGLSPRAVTTATVLAEGGLTARSEAALEIRGLPAFRLEVGDMVDPVPVGGTTTYRISVTNQGLQVGTRIELTATVPPQLRVASALGPNATQARLEGQKLVFPVVDILPPGQALTYTVQVKAEQPGDARFRVELRAGTLREPVVEEESTNVYAAPAAPALPGAAPLPVGPANLGKPAGGT